jgi:hypothetical protein
MCTEHFCYLRIRTGDDLSETLCSLQIVHEKQIPRYACRRQVGSE